MDNKQYGFDLFSYSKASSSDDSERPKRKKMTSLTLFEDLLEKENSENSNLIRTNNIENQHQESPSPIDCDSRISNTEIQQNYKIFNGFNRIDDGHRIYEVINNKLISSLSAFGINTRVETIYKNTYSSITSRAKLESFGIYSKAIRNKRGGNANVKYAWYGAPENEIKLILFYGFGLPSNIRVNDRGVYLSAIDHPFESVQKAVVGEDGLKYILLCRVILGHVEVIVPGSPQYKPSSEQFDNGVDNLASPTKYIIWNTNMNTHILPELVISLRTSSRGCQRNLRPSIVPESDWMPLDSLIDGLSLLLPANALNLLANYNAQYKKHKITRHALIQMVRRIAGDELLTEMIKSYKEKMKHLRAEAQARRLNN